MKNVVVEKQRCSCSVPTAVLHNPETGAEADITSPAGRGRHRRAPSKLRWWLAPILTCQPRMKDFEACRMRDRAASPLHAANMFRLSAGWSSHAWLRLRQSCPSREKPLWWLGSCHHVALAVDPQTAAVALPPRCLSYHLTDRAPQIVFILSERWLFAWRQSLLVSVQSAVSAGACLCPGNLQNLSL